MLPTNRAVRKGQVFTSPNVDSIMLSVEDEESYRPEELIPQELYITSDDEIKEGDWAINYT